MGGVRVIYMLVLEVGGFTCRVCCACRGVVFCALLSCLGINSCNLSIASGNAGLPFYLGDDRAVVGGIPPLLPFCPAVLGRGASRDDLHEHFVFPLMAVQKYPYRKSESEMIRKISHETQEVHFLQLTYSETKHRNRVTNNLSSSDTAFIRNVVHPAGALDAPRRAKLWSALPQLEFTYALHVYIAKCLRPGKAMVHRGCAS